MLGRLPTPTLQSTVTTSYATWDASVRPFYPKVSNKQATIHNHSELITNQLQLANVISLPQPYICARFEGDQLTITLLAWHSTPELPPAAITTLLDYFIYSFTSPLASIERPREMWRLSQKTFYNGLASAGAGLGEYQRLYGSNWLEICLLFMPRCSASQKVPYFYVEGQTLLFHVPPEWLIIGTQYIYETHQVCLCCFTTRWIYECSLYRWHVSDFTYVRQM